MPENTRSDQTFDSANVVPFEPSDAILRQRLIETLESKDIKDKFVTDLEGQPAVNLLRLLDLGVLSAKDFTSFWVLFSSSSYIFFPEDFTSIDQRFLAEAKARFRHLASEFGVDPNSVRFEDPSTMTSSNALLAVVFPDSNGEN